MNNFEWVSVDVGLDLLVKSIVDKINLPLCHPQQSVQSTWLTAPITELFLRAAKINSIQFLLRQRKLALGNVLVKSGDYSFHVRGLMGRKNVDGIFWSPLSDAHWIKGIQNTQ